MIIHELSGNIEQLEIYPLSDLHIGDPKTDIKAFRKFVKFIKAEPNRYLIFNGDNINNAIKSSVSNVYNESMNPKEQKKFLRLELQSVENRFLCFVEGNHEHRSTKETDSTIVEDIAEWLGHGDLYRDDEAFIKVSFGKKAKDGRRATYSLYVVHGTGGGKRPGSSVNNIEFSSMAIDNLDVMVMGHAHKRIAYKYQKRVIDMYNNKVRYNDVLCVVSSAWQDFSGYAARKMLTPGAKGAVPIVLSGREKKAEAII